MEDVPEDVKEDVEFEVLPDNLEEGKLARIGLDKEDEFVRKLVDPKLPSVEEVERHSLMGHVEYRNWCSICVRARGKELDHTRQEDKDRKFPKYIVGAIVFLGMKWDLSGLYWWEGSVG